MGIIEVQNLPIMQFKRLSILILMNFCIFWKLKFTKVKKFRAPNWQTMAVVVFLDSPNSISRKIWVTEKSWTFHTVCFLNCVNKSALWITMFTFLKVILGKSWRNDVKYNPIFELIPIFFYLQDSDGSLDSLWSYCMNVD